MRHSRNGLLLLCAIFLTARGALGQTPAPPAPAPQTDLVAPPAWLFNDLACAPFLTTELPKTALRVVGSQDAVIKNMLGPGDTLVISGGSAAGIQPGQRYYVRRYIKTFGAKGPAPEHPVSVHTAGWIQILGVDSAVATATIVQACDGILLDDYIEPFTAPMIAARSVSGNTPQYANMGHILTADEGFQVGATGGMMNIDRGGNDGVVPGQHYLVFRDKRTMQTGAPGYSEIYLQNVAHLPLVEVGEVVVVAVRPDGATVQIVAAKDGIQTGDFIAEIR